MHTVVGENTEQTTVLTRKKPKHVATDHAPPHQLNYFRAPGFEPEQELDLRQKDLDGSLLDPACLSLDSSDSFGYLQLLEESAWLGQADSVLFDRAADLVLYQIRHGNFSAEHVVLLGLGVGDGRKEIAVMSQILQKYPFQFFAYFLDNNPALVQIAYQNAHQRFEQNSYISVLPILGSIHQLAKLPTLFYSPKGTQQLRVGCLLGDTFAQLQDEVAFLKNSLIAFNPGDLLLLDVSLIAARHDDVETIKQADSFFTFPGEQKAWQRWLAGFIDQHLPKKPRLKIKTSIVPGAGTIPGGYGIELATYRPDKSKLSLLTLKRYSFPSFTDTFSDYGWKLLHFEPFGKDPYRRLCIFERTTAFPK